MYHRDMETTQHICPRSMRGFIICKCCHTFRKLTFICGTSASFSGKTMRTEAVDRQCTLVESYWVSVHTEFFSNLDSNSVHRLPHQQIVTKDVYLFIVLWLWTVHTVSFQLKQSGLINRGQVRFSLEVETDSWAVPLLHQVACFLDTWIQVVSIHSFPCDGGEKCKWMAK
jgi:hypothetical protein